MSRFLPPSLSEVKNYCEMKGYHLDPDSFFSYWKERNWKLDGKSIFNWMLLADKAEEQLTAGHPQLKTAVRPAYIDQSPAEDDISPEELAALIADIERLKAENERQIEEYQRTRKGLI